MSGCYKGCVRIISAFPIQERINRLIWLAFLLNSYHGLLQCDWGPCQDSYASNLHRPVSTCKCLDKGKFHSDWLEWLAHANAIIANLRQLSVLAFIYSHRFPQIYTFSCLSLPCRWLIRMYDHSTSWGKLSSLRILLLSQILASSGRETVMRQTFLVTKCLQTTSGRVMMVVVGRLMTKWNPTLTVRGADDTAIHVRTHTQQICIFPPQSTLIFLQ